ncbi:methyltransferase domain-containing protein [Luteolibacter yonseiensis]|uniref:Methyltransferase domain-containing protein n=1 Tax=Luteolibacter yonseiensis TaxID=1144680 RepID=A0A934R0C2_9BACT|nr:class I SAM-dependent methyltransferase [Luteolibacter yonseiensis]MBK1814392.1 methyltransferase domain-containing protein [Luteolibacter yonseiensis]
MNTSHSEAPHVFERLDVATCGDPFQVHLHEQRYSKALSEVKPSDDLLEIGTGLGVFSSRVAPAVSTYRGIEYDATACTAAKSRVPDPESITQGDAHSLQFPDSSFDAVICLEVLEHLPDYRKALDEAARVLRPEGRLIASIPYVKTGAPSKTNSHHLYEPGEEEFKRELAERFGDLRIYYHRYTETSCETLARNLRLRRFLGLHHQYARMSGGHPEEMRKVLLDSERSGLLLGLFAVACRPRRQ